MRSALAFFSMHFIKQGCETSPREQCVKFEIFWNQGGPLNICIYLYKCGCKNRSAYLLEARNCSTFDK